MRLVSSCNAVLLLLSVALLAGARPSAQQPPPAPAGQSTPTAAKEALWIWTGSDSRPGDRVHVRQRLRLADKPALAKLLVESRGPLTLFVNGLQIQRYRAGAHTVFITRHLDKGPGALAFDVTGGADSSGLRFELEIRYPDGRTVNAYSNGDESTSRQPPIGWQSAAFDDSAWPRAIVLPRPAESAPRTNAPGRAITKPPLTPILPPAAGSPDYSRLVRLWDIRGARRSDQNPYAGPRAIGERMLLSCGMAPDGDLPVLASAGFTLLESAGDTLAAPESAPGVWDYSLADTDRLHTRRAGLDWSYFPHYAFPPAHRRAGPDFTPIRCLEHDRSLPAFSPWDPGFVQYADLGLSSLAQAFGGADGLSAIDLGIHGDYGEAGLFSGARMGVPQLREDWQRRFGDTHAHLGWWCGDALARQSFRAAMMAKYRTLAALNQAWRTDFTSQERIAYPESPVDGSRRRWLDFVHWYRDTVTQSAQAIAEVARKRFPSRALMLPLGFSSEDPRGGNDNTNLIKAAARLGIDVRSTHGGFRPFPENQATMMGRIASAARFYGVPFWNEATGRLSTADETARIFSAISLGAKGLFDWPDNVKAARDIFYRHGKHLRIERPVVDVAMFFPSTSHLLRQEGYPQVLTRGCAEIRDVLNYDIVDEQMALDGALERYRVLVLWEGIVVESAVLAKIRDWVQNGGVLVAYDFGKIETPEGDRTWFADLFGYAGRLRTLPNPAEGEAVERIDVAQLKTEWARPLGRGWTVFFPGRRTRLRGYHEVVRYVTYHLSELDRTKRDALPVDNSWDGVYATLLTDKVIYYNPAKSASARTLNLPEQAVSAQPELRVRPTFQTLNLTVEPGGIAVVPFEPAPQEMLFQCEAFRTLGGLRPSGGPAHHPGAGQTHVLITSGREISTRIRIDAHGTYRVFYRSTRGGQLSSAEVVINGVTLKGSARAPGAWCQTYLAGSVRLAPGVHTLTLRPPARQSARADFVVLTSDAGVAGYAFAEK